MTNPFDDSAGTYLVLMNEQGQYSLWPAFTTVPAGWSIARSESDRQTCVDFIEEQWCKSLTGHRKNPDRN